MATTWQPRMSAASGALSGSNRNQARAARSCSWQDASFLFLVFSQPSLAPSSGPSRLGPPRWCRRGDADGISQPTNHVAGDGHFGLVPHNPRHRRTGGGEGGERTWAAAAACLFFTNLARQRLRSMGRGSKAFETCFATEASYDDG
ncbi:hypothetical protein K456DRAFT_636563 [Colletotrichum gloeosporioides 23]|nr:hypothetical protein K456DRAFT_636563 [Colletotrichum gloeosporioides 23]